MSQRPLPEESLVVEVRVGQLGALFGFPSGGHPRDAFEGDENDPAVAALAAAPVDLSLTGMECITPFQRLDERLKALQMEVQRHPMFNALNPRALEQLIPHDRVPTSAEVNNEVFGTPDRPSNLLSLRPEGRAANTQGLIPHSTNTVPLKPAATADPVKDEEDATLPPDEKVLVVELFHPTRLSRTEEFKVLGSQSLLALRRAIYCVTDCKVSPECRRSACFFINDAFYTDTSHEGYTDYSAVLKQNGVGGSSANCPTRPMVDVTFNDLSIRLGERYVYLHAGGCAHFMIFGTIRLLHTPSDSLSASSYPERTFCRRPRLRRCAVCDVRSAKRVTYNDRLCPENPTFFCDPCFHKLHYSKPNDAGEMQALYTDFEVYKYWHE